MDCNPSWLTTISALLPLVIAVVVAYVAWQQWRTNRNKLKLDLFDRRYAYYEAATELIGKILSSGRAHHEVTFQFLIATKGAKFIVGREIDDYFYNELYSKSIDLQTLDAELQGLGVGEERTANVHKQAEIKKWFGKQFEVLDAKFESVLRLEH